MKKKLNSIMFLMLLNGITLLAHAAVPSRGKITFTTVSQIPKLSSHQSQVYVFGSKKPLCFKPFAQKNSEKTVPPEQKEACPAQQETPLELKWTHSKQKKFLKNALEIEALVCTFSSNSPNEFPSHATRTCLHDAIINNHNIDALATLADISHLVNIKDCYGRTPLFYAVLKQCFTTVRFLLLKGAIGNIPDNNGDTPQALATTIVEIAQRLCQGATDLSNPDLSHQLPLLIDPALDSGLRGEAPYP